MREVKHPKTSQKNMNSAYIKCDSCAHCVDFRTPTPDQAQSLTDAQNAVADEVAKWLSEAEEKRQKAIEEKAAEPDFSDLDYE